MHDEHDPEYEAYQGRNRRVKEAEVRNDWIIGIGLAIIIFAGLLAYLCHEYNLYAFGFFRV